MLEICDDGCGMSGEPGPERCGLTGMGERVRELRAQRHLDAPTGGGLRVSAHLPYKLSAEESANDLHT